MTYLTACTDIIMVERKPLLTFSMGNSAKQVTSIHSMPSREFEHIKMICTWVTIAMSSRTRNIQGCLLAAKKAQGCLLASKKAQGCFLAAKKAQGCFLAAKKAHGCFLVGKKARAFKKHPKAKLVPPGGTLPARQRCAASRIARMGANHGTPVRSADKQRLGIRLCGLEFVLQIRFKSVSEPCTLQWACLGRRTSDVADIATKRYRTWGRAAAESVARNICDERRETTGSEGRYKQAAICTRLTPAARKLVQNMRNTAESMPGTQEARKRMRYEIEALRIRFGTPIFVTFSPDEAHQMLYVRLSRARVSDPVRAAAAEEKSEVGDKDYPSLREEYTAPINMDDLRHSLPTWEQRRKALARDPLASVDGFRVLVLLVMEHLFGLHVCGACPECNLATSPWTPCQDERGSNAKLVGGVFGRMDAAYVTIEAQKSSGSLHAHCQCFVQCLHQHTPLEEIFALGDEKLACLRRRYLRYSGHVMHGVYEGHSQEDTEAKIARAEETWPEHREELRMVSCPTYQNRRACESDLEATEEAQTWAMEYLREDVAKLQFLKQHHYHPFSPDSGERVPLHGCQKADRAGECKSEYPRKAWLTETGLVLCPCKAAAHGMATHGRKNRIGSLHGPYGNEWLNYCHPAMLAALRGANVDVQLPYRLPFDCTQCGNCMSAGQQRDIVRAVQRAQDAQTGYCADYCAKNQPMAFHEIKEFQKGHQQLQQTYQGDNIDKLGKRHVTRFLSDAYCKGIVRGQVECCNLRAYNKPSSVVAAERMSTAAFWSFPGRAYLQAVNTAFDEGDEVARRAAYVWTRKGSSGQRQMREMDPAQVYGHRPQEEDMWYLSPYEFGMYWECMPMRAPSTRGEWKEQRNNQWDVTLTKKGEAKIAAAATDETPVHLLAGVDFERLPRTEKSKKVFFDSSAGRALQHGWYLCRRLRPLCPHMASAPVPSKWGDEVERNAKLTLAYFKAWTLNKKRDTDAVPYVRRLRAPEETWEDALRQWLLRLPCEETKRYVGNFLSVYRVRPDNEGENSDDEDDATELVVTPEKLVEACQTQVPAAEGESRKGKWASHRNLIVEAMEQANKYWKESTSGQMPRVKPWEGADSKSLLKGVRRKTVTGGKATATLS